MSLRNDERIFKIRGIYINTKTIFMSINFFKTSFVSLRLLEDLSFHITYTILNIIIYIACIQLRDSWHDVDTLH